MLVIQLKKDCNTKVTEIVNKLTDNNHDKYIDTSQFNKLAVDIFNVRIAQANFTTKTDFDAKLSSLSRKTTQNKAKHLLVENELNKLKTFDSSYFTGQSHFKEDGTQNYLVQQPINKYLKVITNNNYVSSWKSKELSAESVNPPTASDKQSYTRIKLLWYQNKNTIYWKSFKTTKNFMHSWKRSKHLHCYELGASSSHDNDTTLKNCLFGAVTLTKNADIDKYGYFGYGIGFDRRSSFSFPCGEFGQNVLIFGVDMRFSAQVDNKIDKKTYQFLEKDQQKDQNILLPQEKCVRLILL